jgi:hypothetical protein
MSYKITLKPCGGAWISEVTNGDAVSVFKWNTPSPKELARTEATDFIAKQKDFTSHADTVTETGTSLY